MFRNEAGILSRNATDSSLHCATQPVGSLTVLSISSASAMRSSSVHSLFMPPPLPTPGASRGRGSIPSLGLVASETSPAVPPTLVRIGDMGQDRQKYADDQ